MGESGHLLCSEAIWHFVLMWMVYACLLLTLLLGLSSCSYWFLGAY